MLTHTNCREMDIDFLIKVSLTSLFLIFMLCIFNRRIRIDLANIFRYEAREKIRDDSKEDSESAADRIQFFCQRLIFASLTILLLLKGIIELADSLSLLKDSTNHFITHLKGIKTLSYVANALAISCGFQLAFMLITKGPDEAIEPIMLGIASVILLMLSAIEPQKWSIDNSLSVAVLIGCIGALFYLSKKLNK